jgi:proton-translocating NADH-quinone oxidoreductase chain L
MSFKSVLIGTLFWPLWSATVCGFFGNYLGSYWAANFGVFALLMSFLISCYAVLNLGFDSAQTIISLFTCFSLPFPTLDTVYTVRWALLFDSLTVIMLFVVTSVSGLVHLYATSYMSEDPHKSRFFSCLSLFTFFMLMLVTAENYFQLFVGWEGVGLCSYLLITFWYTRLQANKSALQAVVVNKVGDLALVLALLLLVVTFNQTSFMYLFSPAALSQLTLEFYMGNWSFSLGEVIGFLFFIGAVAKSAQIGLHTWLLSAMEGPTPVSALLHAATMVTAGIFLMIRSHPIIAYAPTTSTLMVLTGALTAFFAATCGLVQHDIKKIIAFSTCSQLGYMFYACGLSNYVASLYHLTNHAFFKALLFLCAGAVIHTLQGEQDLRRMGGLVKVMPVTYISMLIASLSLLGFPFLSGFYSKDILIELAWSHYTIPATFAFWLATMAAFLTAFYSTRLLYYVFLANPNGYKVIYKTVHEADEVMLTAFRPLIIGSIFSGYMIKNVFISFGATFFATAGALNNIEGLHILMDAEFLPFFIKLIPVFFSFAGLFGALFLYSQKNLLNQLTQMQMYSWLIKEIHFFFIKKWMFDILYNRYIATDIYKAGSKLYQLGDQGLLELIGPQGIFNALSKAPTTPNMPAPLQYNVALTTISILMFLFFSFF